MSAEVPFDQWVKYLFDRDATDSSWWATEEDEKRIDLPNSVFIEYATRLFRTPETELLQYSDAQLNAGLKRVLYNGATNEIYAVIDEDVPLEARLGFLRALFDLNAGWFAARCTEHLSHLDRNTTPAHVSALNDLCYMFWDTFILYGQREGHLEVLNKECLGVMARCLDIDHLAVREGALHGLGHFAIYYPDETRELIAQFLRKQTTIEPQLKLYAEAAAEGAVL